MSAPGVVTDTMANIRTAKDASGKEYTYKLAVMTDEVLKGRLKGITRYKFLFKLLENYIKNPKKYVEESWSKEHPGYDGAQYEQHRTTPKKNQSETRYEVWLNKGSHTKEFISNENLPIEFRIFEDQTRIVYNVKYGDWKRDLELAIKDTKQQIDLYYEYSQKFLAPDSITKLKMIAESAKRARHITKAIDNPQTDEEANRQGRVLPQHYELVVGKDELKRRNLMMYKKGLYFKGTDSGYTWSEKPF